MRSDCPYVEPLNIQDVNEKFICKVCGWPTNPTGRCRVCPVCGESTGCS